MSVVDISTRYCFEESFPITLELNSYSLPEASYCPAASPTSTSNWSANSRRYDAIGKSVAIVYFKDLPAQRLQDVDSLII